MACLALIRASSLRAAASTLPNNKSKPCEHWPARCTHVGVGPWPLSWRRNPLTTLLDKHCAVGQRNILASKTLPGSKISDLVRHVSQSLSGGQDVFPLLPSTQLPDLTGFVEDDAQGDLAGFSWEWRHNTRREITQRAASRFYTLVREQIQQLPGCPWGSLSQVLACTIFDSIKARDLFKASISWGKEKVAVGTVLS